MHTLFDIYLMLQAGLALHWGYMQWRQKWIEKDAAWKWYCRAMSLKRQQQTPTLDV